MTDKNDPMILEQLAKLNDKMNSQGERLAVQDTKLDTIQTTLNLELRHLKETVERNHTEHANDIDHLRKGQKQLGDATAKLLDAKANKDDLVSLRQEVQLKADAKALAPWQDGLKAVVVAIVIAVIVGGGGYALGKRQEAPQHSGAQVDPARAPASPAGSPN